MENRGLVSSITAVLYSPVYHCRSLLTSLSLPFFTHQSGLVINVQILHWSKGIFCILEHLLVIYALTVYKLGLNILAVQSLLHHRNAAIIGLACCLLAREGHDNL